MKTNRSIVLLLPVLLLLSGLAGCFNPSSALKEQAGYAALALPESYASHSTFNITVGRSGLAPLRWLINLSALDEENMSPEEAELVKSVVRSIDAVSIQVFEFNEGEAAPFSEVESLATRLKEDGWRTMITVKEDDEHVVVLQAGDDNLIHGLAVLVVGNDQTVLANIIGELKPEEIATATEKLSAPRAGSDSAAVMTRPGSAAQPLASAAQWRAPTAVSAPWQTGTVF